MEERRNSISAQGYSLFEIQNCSGESLIRRPEKILRIQEGDAKPEDEFERRCLEFYEYLKKEIKDPCFYWDEWIRENFETLKTYSLSKDPVLLLGNSG